MYPGMLHWWRMRRHHGECGGEAHPGHGEHGEGFEGREAFEEHGARGFRMGWRGGGDEFSGGPFGVRRPLRFLAFKLNLSEEQVAELAKILGELKTERAQAAVDDRRTTAAFADALGLEKFDEAKAAEGGALRVKSAERLRDAVVKALGRIHALLDGGQRAQLAYLIRTGALAI
jgi:Spy/CpxP family protein refolding chaperone